MKKTVLAAIPLALLLSSCSISELTGVSPEPDICGYYEASCNVTAYIIPPDKDKETEFEFSGDIRRLGGGFWEMSVTAPETICGMKISAADDVITSQLGELSFDIETQSMPEKSPVTAIFSCLDEAAALVESGNSLTSGEEGGWVLSGANSTVIFDAQGIPSSMAVASPKMTVEFTRFSTEHEESSAQTQSETTIAP